MARLFDVIENPLPNTDWYIRKIKHANPIGTDEFQWTVQLMKRADGTPVEFTHRDLYIAWARAIEGARSHEMEITA